MREFLSVCNYSKYRHNILLGILLLILAMIAISLLFLTINNEQPVERTREETINDYQRSKQYLEQDLEIANSNEKRKVIEDKIEYYSYLINNNKIESDYYNIGGMTSPIVKKTDGHTGTAFMMYSLKWFRYVIYIAAVLLPLVLFISELGGSIKNIVGTELTRDKIYNYFFLVSLVIITLLNIIAYICGLIGGLTCINDECLINIDGYKEVSMITIYSWACLGRYILSILFLGIVTLIGIKTKSMALTSVYFVLIIAAAIVIGIMFHASVFQELPYNQEDPVLKLPIIGIESNLIGPSKLSIILLVYHSICAIGVYIVGYRYFKKVDIC